MDMARGREITRVTDHSTGRSILMSAYKVAKIAKPEVRDRVMGIVKYNILADTLCDFVATAVPTELIPEVRAFLADSTIAAVDPAPYYKQFAMMDREVFAAPRFALGLALSSSRIQNYETLDSENKGAWHTGDGMTYIYNGDLAQYGDELLVHRQPLPPAGHHRRCAADAQGAELRVRQRRALCGRLQEPARLGRRCVARGLRYGRDVVQGRAEYARSQEELADGR